MNKYIRGVQVRKLVLTRDHGGQKRLGTCEKIKINRKILRGRTFLRNNRTPTSSRR